MLPLCNVSVAEVSYLDQMRNPSAPKEPCVVFVGDGGQRITMPLVTAVAASPLVASVLCDKCSCIEDATIIMPDVCSKILQMFVDFLVGETICGDYNDLLLLEDLCVLFQIKFQSLEMTAVKKCAKTTESCALLSSTDQIGMRPDQILTDMYSVDMHVNDCTTTVVDDMYDKLVLALSDESDDECFIVEQKSDTVAPIENANSFKVNGCTEHPETITSACGKDDYDMQVCVLTEERDAENEYTLRKKHKEVEELSVTDQLSVVKSARKLATETKKPSTKRCLRRRRPLERKSEQSQENTHQASQSDVKPVCKSIKPKTRIPSIVQKLRSSKESHSELDNGETHKPAQSNGELKRKRDTAEKTTPSGKRWSGGRPKISEVQRQPKQIPSE